MAVLLCSWTSLAYLERQMLQEMCGTIRLVRLCSAAGVDPDTDSRRLSPRRVLSSYCEAIGQSSRLCFASMRDGGREPLGTHGIDGSLTSQGLLKIQRKPS